HRRGAALDPSRGSRPGGRRRRHPVGALPRAPRTAAAGGGPVKLLGILRFELAYQLRRPWPWLSMAVLLVFSLLVTRVGILPVTLPQDFVLNSPFIITTVTVLSCQVWLVVAPAELPMSGWVEIGIFAPTGPDSRPARPLYLRRHRIRSGTQTISVTVPERPARGGIDPYSLLDWEEGDDIEA